MAVLIIFNATDGVDASIKTFRKEKTANAYIKKLREAFAKHQGYYRTNKGERISPDEIDYRVIPRDQLFKQFDLYEQTRIH